ncbi:OmpA family protein [Thermodesulfobacteriota bacterium]
MKKIITIMFCVGFCVAISLPAGSVELSVEAVQANNVPASYATVEDGNIIFGKTGTAYSPDSWDTILTAYGGTLPTDAKVPASYATVKDGNIIFGKTGTAYSPDVTHEILTGYGFTTTPDAMAKVKDPSNYAKVEDGNIVFGKTATAYSPEEFNMLMAAYQLAAKVVIMASEPKVEETVMAASAESKSIILAFEDVHFDFDKSTLTKEAQVILKKSIIVLKDNPNAKIRIAGYTSASGTKEYNQKLSERRANAVQEYLISEGVITRDRLSTIGYGETDPAMYEAAPKEVHSEAAKANMRVLFEIIVQ